MDLGPISQVMAGGNGRVQVMVAGSAATCAAEVVISLSSRQVHYRASYRACRFAMIFAKQRLPRNDAEIPPNPPTLFPAFRVTSGDFDLKSKELILCGQKGGRRIVRGLIGTSAEFTGEMNVSV